jgi:hypothetical protein
MKKQIVSEQRVCDVDGCGTWCYDGYLACGVDHCYSHKGKLGIMYHYSTNYEGRGDGYYCHECDKKLRISGNDPLHTAYLEMEALRKERDAFYKHLEKRNEQLSLHIEVLYDERRKEIDN